jgi:hypothetical protein
MRSTTFAASLLASSFALIALPGAARAEEPPIPSPAPLAPPPDGDCDASTPLPPAFRCARRIAHPGLFIGFGVAAGLGDFLNVVTIAGNGAKDPVAFIPVAGPFIAAATHKPPPPPVCGIGQWFCGPAWDFSVPTYIAAGALQTVGAVFLVSALAGHKSRVELKRGVTVAAAPMVGPSGSGLGLSGTF